MFQRDYLMRQIKAVSEAIARIAGLSRSGRVGEVEQELTRTFTTALGVSRADAARLSPSSLVLLIGKERAALAADLWEAEAAHLDAVGKKSDAAASRTRAAAVRALTR